MKLSGKLGLAQHYRGMEVIMKLAMEGMEYIWVVSITMVPPLSDYGIEMLSKQNETWGNDFCQ